MGALTGWITCNCGVTGRTGLSLDSQVSSNSRLCRQVSNIFNHISGGEWLQALKIGKRTSDSLADFE
jgi:hypothetical protein